MRSAAHNQHMQRGICAALRPDNQEANEPSPLGETPPIILVIKKPSYARLLSVFMFMRDVFLDGSSKAHRRHKRDSEGAEL